MQIPRNIVNRLKSNKCFGGTSGYRLRPETTPPLLAEPPSTMRMFKIVFRDNSLYPNQLSLFCLLWLINASADRTGYNTNFCSMIELLHALENSSFNTQAFRNLIMTQQGKRKTKSLLDFYT